MKMPYKYRCPACGKKSGVNVAYGMPSENIAAVAKKGEVILSMCCIVLDSSERKYLSSGHEWQIKRCGQYLSEGRSKYE